MSRAHKLTEAAKKYVSTKIKFNDPGIGMSNFTQLQFDKAINGISIALLKKGGEHSLRIAAKGTKIDGGKVDGTTIRATGSVGPGHGKKMFKAALAAANDGESDLGKLVKAGLAAIGR